MMKLQEFFYPSPFVMMGETDEITERLKPYFYVVEKQVARPPIVRPPSVATQPLYGKGTAPAPPPLRPQKGSVATGGDSLFWAIYGEMSARKPAQYDGGFGVTRLVAEMQ